MVGLDKAAHAIGSGVSGAMGGGLNAGSGAGTPAAPFSGMLKSAVQQTNILDQKASAAVTGLLNGQGVEIHDAMIATQKANLAFELGMQVRNKAVAAYQQMMGMQF